MSPSKDTRTENMVLRSNIVIVCLRFCYHPRGLATLQDSSNHIFYYNSTKTPLPKERKWKILRLPKIPSANPTIINTEQVFLVVVVSFRYDHIMYVWFSILLGVFSFDSLLLTLAPRSPVLCGGVGGAMDSAATECVSLGC